MSGVRLQERLYGQTGKEDGSGETPREDDKSVSHLLERIGVATVKKKIVYGMEIKTLFYFRIRGK
jgi:hypothetical protein